MADKEDLTWNFYDNEETAIPQGTAPAAPATAAENTSRSGWEVAGDVLAGGIDALANGGNTRQIIGGMLQAGIGTDRYMAQKRILANQAALSDLNVRKAQRAEDREIANMPVDNAAREVAKKRLVLQGEQTDTDLILARQRRIGVEKRLVANEVQNRYANNPSFMALTPEAQQEFRNSRAVRAEEQFMLVGRKLLEARQGKPGAYDEAKEVLRQLGAELVEVDGKHYVVYTGPGSEDVGQSLELNERNMQTLLTAVQKRSADELNNYVAYSPANVAGDTMNGRVAYYADQYRKINGGDYNQAVERSKQAHGKLSQQERDIYGLRHALENLMLHPDDPSAQQAAMMFISTPNGTTKSVLQRAGWEGVGFENPDWITSATVFKRNPDGTKGESMNLQEFLQWLRENDTATPRMDQVVKDDIERMKQNVVMAESKAADWNIKRGRGNAAATLNVEYGDKLKDLSSLSQNHLANSSEWQTLGVATMLTQANGSVEQQKQIIRSSGGQVFEKDGKPFFKYGEHEGELTPENIKKLRAWAKERVDNSISSTRYDQDQYSGLADALSPEEKQEFYRLFPSLMGGKPYDKANALILRSVPLSAQEKAITSLHGLFNAQGKQNLFKGENLEVTDEHVYAVTGYNVKADKDGNNIRFVKYNAFGKEIESLTYDEFLGKLSKMDTGAKKIRDFVYQYSNALPTEKTKKNDKNNNGGSDEGGGGNNLPPEQQEQAKILEGLYGTLYATVPQEKQEEFVKDIFSVHADAATLLPGKVRFNPQARNARQKYLPQIDIANITTDEAKRIALMEKAAEEKAGIKNRQRSFWYHVHKLKETEEDFKKAKEWKNGESLVRRIDGLIDRTQNLVSLGLLTISQREAYLNSLGLRGDGEFINPKMWGDIADQEKTSNKIRKAFFVTGKTYYGR